MEGGRLGDRIEGESGILASFPGFLERRGSVRDVSKEVEMLKRCEKVLDVWVLACVGS